MSYVLFYPTRSMVEDAGFSAVADVPALFDSNWKYHRIASRYLRDRAFGNALPYEAGGGLIPTSKSLQTFARALIDFLEWCEWTKPKITWEKIKYNEHLILRYQAAMQDGTWSSTEDSLKSSTINARIGEATNFLTWAALRNLREPFNVPATTSYRQRGGLNSHSHKRIAVQGRTGRLRVDPRDVTIPSEEKIKSWLSAVSIKKSYTIELMCRLTIRTGIRREECVQWDISYLDIDPNKWKISGNYVVLPLRFGTKGRKFADKNRPEKPRSDDRKQDRTVGPKRSINIPLELAQELHKYRNSKRVQSIMKYVNSAPDETERKRRFKETKQWDRLFISEYNGQPIQGETLRRAFKINAPFEEWSPQLARHYYACSRILESLRRRAGSDLQKGPDWVKAYGEAELLLLKKQLGHIDEKTTETYLVWLLHAFGHVNDYSEALEGDFSSEGV